MIGFILAILSVSVDLSTLSPVQRWCNPDRSVCIEGAFVRNVGKVVWRGVPRVSFATTEAGVPFSIRFDPPVKEFWWRTLPASYGCYTPTVTFCGTNTYDQTSICQTEWRLAGCYAWNGGTPNDGWTIEWASFYNAELWDVVTIPVPDD